MSIQPSTHNASTNSPSTVALARGSLFKFDFLLAGVFLLAAYLLVFLANDLDHTEEVESAFYTEKAVRSLEKSLTVTVKDYAFWGDAYRYLHLRVDPDWAFVRQNVGPTLYSDFGFQGLFVVDEAGQTVYAVVEGELENVSADTWLGQAKAQILATAREGAETETPVTMFIDLNGTPAVVAAAAITPGTDPTVELDGRAPSVLIFVDVLDDTKLAALGKEYGVDGLHVATPDERPQVSIFPLGEGRANVGCGALATSARPARTNVKKLLREYHGQVRDQWQMSEPEHVTSALLPMGGAVSNVAGPNWALLGDAACLVNPLNGEGIDYGMESARLAVELISSIGAGRDGLTHSWPALLREHYGTGFSLARKLALTLTYPSFLPTVGPLTIGAPWGSQLMGVAARLMGNLVTEHDRDVVARLWRASGRTALASDKWFGRQPWQ